MTTHYEDRQKDQRRIDLYREAAAKQVGVKTDPHAHVQLMKDGAFVDVCIWVPLAAIEPCETNHHIWTNQIVGAPCNCGRAYWG